MVFEVFEKTFHREGGVSFGEFVAIGQELGAAREFADGVLETRQAIGLHLGPVERNVGEVFDVHLEAGKRGIGCFNGPQIVFALVAALGFTGEVFLAEDAVQGVVADLEIELCDEAARAEAGGFFAFGDKFGLPFWSGFMGAGMRGAAQRDKAIVVIEVKAAEPFSDRVAGALVEAGGRLDAFFESISNQLVAEGEFGIGGADHGVVR